MILMHPVLSLHQEGNADQVSGGGGSVVVEGLKLMTNYQIEWKVCTQGARPKCSQWSAPMRVLTPGVGEFNWSSLVWSQRKTFAQNTCIFYEQLFACENVTLQHVNLWHTQ